MSEQHSVDPGRCPYVNLYYRNSRGHRMREDGWRCGNAVDHANSHTLYSSEGESILDQMGPWILAPECVPTSDRGHATLDLCLASATIGLACLALIEPRLLLVVAGCLVAWLVLSVPLALGMGRLLARGGEEG